MQGTRGRRHVDGEAGVGAVEYIGVIVVVVALVGSLLVAVTPVGQAIAAKLCEAFGATCGAVTSAERAPEDYVPPEPCVVSSHGRENGANVSFVVTIEGGETFYVDSVDEAENLLGQQRQDDVKDVVLGDDNPLRNGYDWVAGKLGDDQEGEQREPDEWFVEGGMYADASAGAAGGLPGLNVDAEGEAAVEAYLGRTERSDGTSTDYLRAELSGDIGISGNGPDAQGSDSFRTAGVGGEMDALVEIDRDAGGNPVAMRVVSTVGGHAEDEQSYSGTGGLDDASSMTARTIQIPLETESDMLTASRFLQTTGLPYVPGVTDPSDVGQRAVTPEEFVDVAADLGELATDRGHLWEQEYTSDDSTDLAVQVDAELGAITGIGGSSVSNGTATTGYRYWDGEQMVAREGCAA